jgi:uroporphyrinogen-III synthase
MIFFEQIAESIDFSNVDTLIFTSKQAVATADKIDKNWKNFPVIAIGGATKAKVESLGGKVIHHPKKFYGESLASDIKKYFETRKLLYLRPQEVSFDTKGFLEKEGISIREEIIYRTSCLKYGSEKKPLEGSTIIFTSPSTIRCFLKNFEWDSSYTAVLIGNATKAHLPKGCRYAVADKPLIDACIEKAKNLNGQG